VYCINPLDPKGDAQGVNTYFNQDGKAHVTLELVKNQKYVVLFWAQNEETWVSGEEFDLTQITYPDTDTDKLKANLNKYEAFCGAAFVGEVTGATKKSVTLTRPFAQINLASSDPANYDVDIVSSSVKIENAYPKFNVATKKAFGDVRTVEYEDNENPGGKFGNYDHYVAMNYIFANPKNDGTTPVKVTCTITTQDHGAGIVTAIDNVPVAQNYKTNIVGNLLTSDVDYEVSLNDSWGTPDEKVLVTDINPSTRTITINSVDELLSLNSLNENWIALFSNGQGTDITNFFVENGGKGADYYYKWDWTIKLNADLDLNNITLDAPINVTSFGCFDGKNHTIKNVKIKTATDVDTAAGLFEASKACKMQNIKLDNVHVTGSLVGGSTAGILVSDCNSGINNITITNSSVYGGKYTGGVVGYGYTYVTNCTLTNCVVKGGYKLGGVIGYICASDEGNDVTGCTLTGCTVSGTDGQYADGKSEYVMGKVVGNYNCNGTCSNNTVVTTMATEATNIIGKIETGKNVTIENNLVGRIVYGLTIIPNGANSKIIVKDKEGFLNLTRLLAEWTALFTDGNGNEYDNYASGAGVDYYYGDRWTISLEADIDLNNATISPVILNHPENTGAPTFDGNNHTIKNANIVTDANTDNNAGLFDASKHNALKNLKLDNIHVTGSNVGNSTAGVLSGYVSANVQYITITNSSVTGGKYTGGITGYSYTDVTNCSLTNVTVKGGYKLGGVIGYIAAESGTGDVTSNTLTDCTVDGIGGVYAGGKEEYVIGKVVGNYNCNGTCSGNTVTRMTTGATQIIGKTEAGKTVTVENNVMGVSSWDELKTSIVNGDIIELDNDITVDKWIMFSEDRNIGDGTIITIKEINVTIDGKGHTLTINAIESAGNGDFLFQGASNLNISNLTLKYADGLKTGGLGLVSGVIEKVHFVGGGASAASAAIFPKNGKIEVKDCIFDTNGVAFYSDDENDNLTVTGCTFNQKADKNVILLRGDVHFTNNIINSGRTVNIVSGSPVVTGNNFNNVRLKVYAAATATISKNIINTLEFSANTYSSTFTENTLSADAQAALDAATKN
jgi:hypothetical protein